MSDPGGERASAPAVDPEELARANLYGLVSRLFYDPADPNLLAEICHGGQSAAGQESAPGLAAAWRRLQEASQRAHPAVVRQEYDGLFVGVGKAEVTPYLSAYAESAAPDRYLVRLREQLAAWGLARRENVGEVEDHISGITDVMRWLIEKRHPLAEQREFFEGFAYPGATPFFVAVHNAASAGYFKLVAGFASSFFELEKAAFEMEDNA